MNVNISKLIEAIKLRYNLDTDKQIADIIGTSRGNLSNMIKGRIPISKPIKIKLQDSFNVNPEYLNGLSSDIWADSSDKTDTKDLPQDKRLDYVLDNIKMKYGIKSNEEISKVLGKGVNFISDLKNEKIVLDDRTSKKFALLFDINPLFLSGESDVLWLNFETKNRQTGNNNTNIQGNDNAVNQDISSLLEKAISEISEQRKLTSQAQELALNAQNLHLESSKQISQLTELLKILSPNK